VAGIPRTFYLYIEAINRPPQSRETISLSPKAGYPAFHSNLYTVEKSSPFSYKILYNCSEKFYQYKFWRNWAFYSLFQL
jgi:hypothetical protein